MVATGVDDEAAGAGPLPFIRWSNRTRKLLDCELGDVALVMAGCRCSGVRVRPALRIESLKKKEKEKKGKRNKKEKDKNRASAAQPRPQGKIKSNWLITGKAESGPGPKVAKVTALLPSKKHELGPF